MPCQHENKEKARFYRPSARQLAATLGNSCRLGKISRKPLAAALRTAVAIRRIASNSVVVAA